MLLRKTAIEKGRSVLSGWEDASEFTKLFILIESTARDGEGYSIYEMAVILHPADILPATGAPTRSSVATINSLRTRIRHHPVNTMLAPYAIVQKVIDDDGKERKGWVTMNIRNSREWQNVLVKMNGIIDGYRRNMNKFGKIVGLGMAERKRRFDKYIQGNK